MMRPLDRRIALSSGTAGNEITPEPAWLSENFEYGFPLPAPVAVAGCEECACLAATLAAIRRDRSAATDARVLMRRHLTCTHM